MNFPTVYTVYIVFFIIFKKMSFEGFQELIITIVFG
jgi:hypothetical protein